MTVMQSTVSIEISAVQHDIREKKRQIRRAKGNRRDLLYVELEQLFDTLDRLQQRQLKGARY